MEKPGALLVSLVKAAFRVRQTTPGLAFSMAQMSSFVIFAQKLCKFA
jgi:hypothetical protein